MGSVRNYINIMAFFLTLKDSSWLSKWDDHQVFQFLLSPRQAFKRERKNSCLRHVGMDITLYEAYTF